MAPTPSHQKKKPKNNAQDMAFRYHTHKPSSTQCSSTVVQTIDAPLAVVWSVVRRFDRPQAYKRFISSCSLQTGTGDIGSVRELTIVSGLPAKTSTERLDALDDDKHVISFSIVGGDHRLVNYRSTMTLHESDVSPGITVVMESYVVDVPSGSTNEDTCLFADTIIRCNLKSLDRISEQMVSASRATF